jgi:phosphoribosylanthranilate isomerase
MPPAPRPPRESDGEPQGAAVARFVRCEAMDSSSAPKIKFCGITDRADAEAAVSAGAWALGVILWSGSPRHCRRSVAAEIAGAHRRQSEIVGVFVNPTLDHVTRAADEIELTMLQLHGDEGPAFCAEAARRTGCRVIKAARVRSRADIQALAPFHTDLHLLDSYKRGVPGGSGETFAWELVGGRRSTVPLILSGGLTPANVADAIAAVHPYAVDVASGVERSPGHKDHDKLAAFADAVASTAEVPAAEASAAEASAADAPDAEVAVGPAVPAP